LPDATELLHGTCVALGRTAALLRGPSGSGKSDLALRFLFLARRGPAALEAPILVADDQVCLVRNGGRLLVSPPGTIRGRIEVRGVGIVEVKSLMEADLALVVDLVPALEIERLPEGDATARLLGVELPRVALFPWEGSAPIKLVIALARAKHS
jgi:serine kinase of HPr protein (carbohydrate metabolism regulator)